MDKAKESQLDFYDALDLHFTESQKSAIVFQLEELLKKERREAPEFKFSNYGEIQSADFNKRFFHYFKVHNQLINLFYAPPKDSVFKLSDKYFINDLLSYLSGLETKKMSDYEINDHKCNQIFATLPLAAKHKNNIKLGHYASIKHFIIKRHPLIQRLQKIIREAIKDDIISPFSIVNTRAWSISPGATKLGAYRNHNDGFLPGHLKIMVYLNPMNNDYGYLVVNENKITDQAAGTCVLFKNSDIEHRGVSGEMFERTCIEITIQRTFVNLEQPHDGHPIGRHYASLNAALTNHSNDGTINFRTN
jgi:hypothetical protein